jgi:hypothetical protein
MKTEILKIYSQLQKLFFFDRRIYRLNWEYKKYRNGTFSLKLSLKSINIEIR